MTTIISISDAVLRRQAGAVLFVRALPLWLVAALAAPAVSAEPETPPAPPPIETNVGLEGVYYARVTGMTLDAKPLDDKAPIALRIADAVQDGNSTIYEIRYIGAVPGTYDLRDYLVWADPDTQASLEPMPVVVQGLLPDDHDGSLYTIARPAARTPIAYRALLVVAAAVWLLVPAWLLVRRWTRKSAAEPLLENGRPTLADQLRPLVEAAVAGRVGSPEKARLERLLIVHWRRQLDLQGCTATEAVQRLRQHPESGKLLNQLEQWLHQPPGTTEVDVATLLQPYRSSAPIQEEELITV